MPRKGSAVAVVLLAVAALWIVPRPATAAGDSSVMAFYYPWYNVSDFNHAQMFDVPAQPYNSDDRSTFERHVKEASAAGISGFISSWMGRGNRTDRNFAMLLEASKGTDFKSTIYFESGSIGSASAAVDQLRYVMATYGGHPNFARVSGKPAIFVWAPAAIGSVDTWRSIRAQVDPQRGWHWNVETDRPENWLDVFDGVHLFSAASWTSDATGTYKNLRSKVDAVSARTGQPKVWAAGVAPGWDNTRQDTGVKVLVGREGGSYYSRRWDAAIASNPDLVTITSWNEWGEGTAIEPGAGFGSTYLDITRQKTAAFRAGGGAVSQVSSSNSPGFTLGFKALADRIGAIAGRPLEEEHHNPANGDSLQQTTTGLMVWRKADNWTAFTDGSRTWVNGPYGVQVRPNGERFAWEAQ